MTLGKALLELRDVAATYNHAIVALHGVSLIVRTGEIVALLGANGAGKTTTLMAASNLLAAQRGQITRGTVLFDGQEIRRSSTANLVESGLVQVLEGRHVFRALTIEENLITGALTRRPRRAEVKDSLDYVYACFPRLKLKRKILAGLASGGEQQMTAIGRALMARPRLLILDEPSMGLAPLVVEDIFKTLKSLNGTEGLSLLIAEQNTRIALHYADRAYVLENGQVAHAGIARELRERDDIKAFYLGQGAHAGPALHISP